MSALDNLPEPPAGFDSWLRYALSHQHVGTDCWRCVAIKNADVEILAMAARTEDLAKQNADLRADNERLAEIIFKHRADVPVKQRTLGERLKGSSD